MHIPLTQIAHFCSDLASFKAIPNIDIPEFNPAEELTTANLTSSNKDSEITKFLEAFDKKNEEIST